MATPPGGWRGPANPRWTGESVTYSGMHQRVRYIRGRASDHACAECGQPARHWSYDHADPDERMSDMGAYSANLDHYIPQCVPCHKRLDLSLKPVKADTPIDLELVKELHGQGMRLIPMAKRLGVGRRRVQRAFDELGLPRFAPGNPQVVRNPHPEAPAGAS